MPCSPLGTSLKMRGEVRTISFAPNQSASLMSKPVALDLILTLCPEKTNDKYQAETPRDYNPELLKTVFPDVWTEDSLLGLLTMPL